METLDDIVDANRLNVQLLVLVPAGWLIVSAMRISFRVLVAVRTK